MNRKDRRAAQKQGKGGGPLPRAQGLSPAALSANLFASAVQHFRAGHLEQAERACRDVLMFDANHADALHLLGMIAFQVGNHDAALELIGKAIATRSTDGFAGDLRLAPASGEFPACSKAWSR